MRIQVPAWGHRLPLSFHITNPLFVILYWCTILESMLLPTIPLQLTSPSSPSHEATSLAQPWWEQVIEPVHSVCSRFSPGQLHLSSGILSHGRSGCTMGLSRFNLSSVSWSAPCYCDMDAASASIASLELWSIPSVKTSVSFFLVAHNLFVISSGF